VSDWKETNQQKPDPFPATGRATCAGWHEDGVWVVNTNQVGDLALLPLGGGLGAAGPMTLRITATAFDHTSVTSTTEDLRILVNQLQRFGSHEAELI
jgi:hypothetical protein